MLQLTASDIYSYYRPSECNLRIYLRHRGDEEAPPGPYEQVLFRLAERHERRHLAAFTDVVDLSEVQWDKRFNATVEALTTTTGVIYQGAFSAQVTIDGVVCGIIGNPDFLIKSGDRCVIRDSKISRRINEDDHPEILRQLELYGWLYEHTCGKPPRGLEVHSGTGTIVPIAYDGGGRVLDLLARILRNKLAASEVYEPVGWSKCDGCGFFGRCWPRAEARKDIALVGGVDQGLARALHERGIQSFDGLLEQLDEAQLAALERPWGNRVQRVGARAPGILRNARALAERREILLQQPVLADCAHYVMLDLEGLPPHLDETEKIYLWGLDVHGQNASGHQAATAGFGVEGDRQGWEDFLRIAGSVFARYGDLPFVHWSHYERTKVDMYLKRHGDRGGVGARVIRNLLNLLPITQQALVLPLSSYSLKVVEAYVGFKRERPGIGGDWAMARYIQAIETEDPDERAAVMAEILDYNREDLAATLAVFEWLKRKGAADTNTPRA